MGKWTLGRPSGSRGEIANPGAESVFSVVYGAIPGQLAACPSSHRLAGARQPRGEPMEFLRSTRSWGSKLSRAYQARAQILPFQSLAAPVPAHAHGPGGRDAADPPW